MTRFAPLILIALLAAWSPDDVARRYAYEDQALTRAVPTLSTEGVSASTAIVITVVVIPKTAPGTTTLSGGGMIDLFFCDTSVGWYEGDPNYYSWSLAGCSGLTSCSYTFEILQPHGRMLARANGVTVSAGTQVTVHTITTVSLKSTPAL
jgi:hypothetical protein